MNRITLAILLAIGGIAVALLSLSAGPMAVSPLKIPSLLLPGPESVERAVLMSFRLPRLMMALVIGSSLAVSGAVFQAVMKNPLADPYTTGVSGGAAIGATAAIACSLGYSYVALFAFCGATGAVLIVYGLTRLRRLDGTGMVLAGIALSFILSSGVLLVFALSRAEYVHRALLWLMGDLSLARYESVVRALPAAAALMALAFLLHRRLDIISFGEEFAMGLGVGRGDVLNLFWIASLLAALCVSLAGVIGFVGLIVPHFMRPLTGPSHRFLIPASALGGALLLALTDALGRMIAPPYEIPAGIITGFFGGLFFLLMLLRARRD